VYYTHSRELLLRNDFLFFLVAELLIIYTFLFPPCIFLKQGQWSLWAGGRSSSEEKWLCGVLCLCQVLMGACVCECVYTLCVCV